MYSMSTIEGSITDAIAPLSQTMVAARLCQTSVVVLNTRSASGSQGTPCCSFTMPCCSFTMVGSSYLGPREAASAGSVGAAGFSGRTSALPSRFQLSVGTRYCNRQSSFVILLGGRLGLTSYNFHSHFQHAIFNPTVGTWDSCDGISFLSHRLRLRQRVSQVFCRGFFLLSVLKAIIFVGLIDHPRRARHIPRVSTSPAADPNSMPIYFASEVPIEAEEEECLTAEEYLTNKLPPDLQPELMPKHVAIIMDGNARWAKGRGLHLSFGHAAGAEALMQVARVASEWGINALTVFAFSTENWSRPQVEVDFLMYLFETKLHTEMAAVMRYNFRLRFVGNVSTLPLSVQEAVESASQFTRGNTGMIINICVNYSGRADLVQACRQLAALVAEGTLSPSDIDDSAISEKVFMSELGELQDPDLVIRTSGEQRISNFLLWQVAYSELVFLNTLWPDFGKEDFKAALINYQQRDRRYGMRAA